MESSLNLTSLSQQFPDSQRATSQTGNTSPVASEAASPAQQVSANPELPSTSQLQDARPALENRSTTTNREELNPVVQQQQIESFLAEQSGEETSSFQGIDIESALDLQESFRERPTEATFSPAPEAPDQPVADANEQQDLQLQQTLQSRLAEQIPNDPGTQFPQLINTFA